MTHPALPFLEGAEPQALAEAMAALRWRDLAPGATAVEHGEASRDVFFVAAGAMRVLVRDAQGQETIFGDLGRGEIFGEMAAIDGAARSASITALTACRLAVLPGPAFLRLVERSPVLLHRLLGLLLVRLRAQEQRLLDRALPVRWRLVAELLHLARPSTENPPARRISPPPTHQVLAARIGARREAVTRELGQLTREGLVLVDRAAIRLPNPSALETGLALARGA
jgi:CRP/FNR family cyclic AMP-dependent transcriptional regulator